MPSITKHIIVYSPYNYHFKINKIACDNNIEYKVLPNDPSQYLLILDINIFNKIGEINSKIAISTNCESEKHLILNIFGINE